MTIAWMMVADALIQGIIKERMRFIKHQVMISGSSLSAYWIGTYLADICFQLIPAIGAIIGIHVFGIDVPGAEWLFLAMVLANPLFIYFMSFFFEKDDTGSLAIKILYLVLGVVAPITMVVLNVINEDTIKVAKVLRWFFYPFPIYSLTYGYLLTTERLLL